MDGVESTDICVFSCDDLVHNHPNEEAEQSENDKEVAKILRETGRLLGIEVLDHIIIGKDGCVSFKEAGVFTKVLKFNSQENGFVYLVKIFK